MNLVQIRLQKLIISLLLQNQQLKHKLIKIQLHQDLPLLVEKFFQTVEQQ
ncbi:hypothetical protein ES705_12658 [subsurface metagenome]